MALEPDHAVEDASVRPEAEDRAAQHVVEELVGLGVVVVDDESTGLPAYEYLEGQAPAEEEEE